MVTGAALRPAADQLRLDDFFECCDDITALAMKRIETEDDRDAYTSIARRLSRLARGRLPLENIESEVDLDARSAWLTFRLDGEAYRLAPAWCGEWIDMDTLAKLSALLRARAPRWSFYVFEDDDEGMITTCLDHDGYLRLRAAGAPIIQL